MSESISKISNNKSKTNIIQDGNNSGNISCQTSYYNQAYGIDCELSDSNIDIPSTKNRRNPESLQIDFNLKPKLKKAGSKKKGWFSSLFCCGAPSEQ